MYSACQTLIRYIMFTYFSCGLSFHFLDNRMDARKFLILMKSNLSIFPFFHTFGVLKLFFMTGS